MLLLNWGAAYLVEASVFALAQSEMERAMYQRMQQHALASAGLLHQPPRSSFGNTSGALDPTQQPLPHPYDVRIACAMVATLWDIHVKVCAPVGPGVVGVGDAGWS